MVWFPGLILFRHLLREDLGIGTADHFLFTVEPTARDECAIPRHQPQLAIFRKSIDNIDAAIIHMLAERFRITQAVGEYKAKVTLPPADPGREKRQIERLRALSEAADLDPEFSEKFLRFIIDEVIRHHESARQK